MSEGVKIDRFMKEGVVGWPPCVFGPARPDAPHPPCPSSPRQFDKARRRGVILSSAAKSFLISSHARAGDGLAAANVLDAAAQDATLNGNPGDVPGNMVRM